MYLDEQGKCLRQLLNREAANVFTRVFHKRHFEEEEKIPTQYATGGHLGRIYPEGEVDRTGLGGC